MDDGPRGPGSSEAFKASLRAAAFAEATAVSDSIVKRAWDEKAGKAVLDGLSDETIYTGLGGVAYHLFRRYQCLARVDQAAALKALETSYRLVDACIQHHEASQGRKERRGGSGLPVVTFVLGGPGLYALGAAIVGAALNTSLATGLFKGGHAGGQALLSDYVAKHEAVGRVIASAGDEAYEDDDDEDEDALPCELLYGRVGYLYSCMFLDAHVASSTSAGSAARGNGSGAATSSSSSSSSSSTAIAICHQVLRIGRKGAASAGAFRLKQPSATGSVLAPPLFYWWHGSPYTGAAHGLCGIAHVLTQYLFADRPATATAFTAKDKADVLNTLRYLIALRYPHTLNMPSSADAAHLTSSSSSSSSSAEQSHDKLVQFCHGATGFVMTLARAYEVTGEEEFLKAAVESGEVVWKRGLVTKLGLCHGVAGNGYAFLALERALRKRASTASSASTSAAAVGTGPSESRELADLYLRRARCFAWWLLNNDWKGLVSTGAMHGGDRDCSLFEGQCGLAWMLSDVAAYDPEDGPASAARRPYFPGYELPTF